jgi:uncharacterized membrane protein YfcA
MPHITLLNVALIVAVGIACGFINAIAGAGSLLTLPVLIFMGLPTAAANGTNRVAIEVQSVFAIMGFRSKGVAAFKESLLFSLPTLAGAIIGALLAIRVPDSLFKPILSVVMIVMLGVIFYNPAKRLKRAEVRMTPLRWIAAGVAFFLAGIFGGFIQAGVGFLLISILVGIIGLDLVKTNAHKVFIVGIFTLVALAIFALKGQVNWILGITLSVGNGLGGWLGSRFAVVKGEKWIQAFMVLAVVIMAVKLSGLIPGF